MASKTETVSRSLLSVDFLDTHLKHRKKIRDMSKKVSLPLLSAHQLALGAIASLQGRVQGKRFENARDEIVQGMFLIAQFVQGIELTETAISEGLYPQAANLLKQELETLASLEELRLNGSRPDGKTPKFRGSLKGFGKRYGELNELAHPTRAWIVESLARYEDGDKAGPTTIPQFNADLYKQSYGNQILFMVKLFGHMENLFEDVFNISADQIEENLIVSVLGILQDEGIIKGVAE